MTDFAIKADNDNTTKIRDKHQNLNYATSTIITLSEFD